MKNRIAKLLSSLGCRPDLLEPETWDRHGSTYPIDQLKKFLNLSQTDCEIYSDQHYDFCELFSKLENSERLELQNYAVDNLIRNKWIVSNMSCTDPDPNLRIRMISERLSKYSSDAHILEVGSSHGWHGCLCYYIPKKISATLHACDILPTNNQLLTLLGVHSKFWDARNMRLNHIYSENQFDAVVCTEILEHMDQACQDMLLISASKILKPGGSLFITYPKYAGPEKYSENVDPLGHRRQPNQKDIIQTCAGLICTENTEYRDYRMQEGIWMAFQKPS